MLHYTYLHRRASDNQPFYIGKGSDNRAYRKNHRNQHWNNTVRKHGLVVEIVCHWPTEKEALDHEVFLIDCFRSMGHKLVNLTDGGEGQSGRVPSHETRAKISAANKGRASKYRGIPLSDETKRKLSQARTGSKLSDEHREKLSAAGKGKSKSPEHARKIGLGRMSASGKSDKPVLCIQEGKSFANMGAATRWLKSIGFLKASKAAISRVCNDQESGRIAYGYQWKFIKKGNHNA